MNEPSPIYYADLIPTPSELKLLARLRQLRGMCIVDSVSMTLWAANGPEYCNGKRPKSVEEQIVEVRNG